MKFGRQRLFVSYRRSDAEGSAGRLADALALQFGRDRVFLDSQKIPFGADFVRVVSAEIARADVVIAVIGAQWLEVTDARGRRLDQDDDPVRYELALALQTGKRIVPVLVDGALPPPAERLPAVLAPLATRNAATVGNAVTLRNAVFADDFDLLIDELLGRPRGTLRTEVDHLRRLVVGARGAAVVVPAVALAAALGAWSGLFDLLQLDTHVQRVLLAQVGADTTSAGPVLLATIDADTERRLGRRWPEPRAAWRASHAALVDRAAAAGARAVVFDLAFDCTREGDPCDPELAALAAAARRAAQRQPPTAVVYGVRHAGTDGVPRLAPVLRGTGGTGHVCLFERGNGALYSVPLGVLRGQADTIVSAEHPALAVAALFDRPLRGVDLERRTLVVDGPLRDPPLGYSSVERRREALPKCPLIAAGDRTATLLLRPAPAGYWHGAGRRVAYAALLEAAVPPDAALAGRIVLVGATTDNADDKFVVHDGLLSSRIVPGVELHADAIAALAADRVPRLATADLQVTTGAFAALVGATIVLAVPRGWRRAGAIVLAAAAWVGACLALARHDRLMNPAYDIAALLLSAAAVLALLRVARRSPVRGRRA